MARAHRHCPDIQPVAAFQCLANPDPVKTRVAIARIISGQQPRSLDDFCQFGATPAQQRAQQRQIGTGHIAARAHPCQPGHPARPVQPHDQRFGLIVRVMRSGDGAQSTPPGPVAQRAIARHPRHVLDIALRHFHGKDFMRNLVPGAQFSHHRRFRRAFRAQAMIDRGDFHPARHDRFGQQQQGEAVRPARNREAQLLPFRPQPREIAREARDQRMRGVFSLAVNCRSPACGHPHTGPATALPPAPDKSRRIRPGQCRRAWCPWWRSSLRPGTAGCLRPARPACHPDNS